MLSLPFFLFSLGESAPVAGVVRALAAGGRPALLAALFATEHVSFVDIGLLICGLTTVVAILRVLRGGRKDLVKDVITELAAAQADSAKKSVPQPLVVQADVQFVPRQTFEELALRVNGVEEDLANMERRIYDKIDESFKHLSHERSVSIARLHERVENEQKITRSDIDSKVGKVREEVHAMPDRIIALLRNFNAIGEAHHHPRK